MALVVWWLGRACAAPPPSSVVWSPRDGVREGDGGLPGPIPSLVPHPCLPSRASLPFASTTLAAPAAWACAARGVCRVLSGCAVVAWFPLPRQRLHGWRSRVSSSCPPRGRECPCLAGGVDLAVGGEPLCGRTAAGHVRRVVGRGDPLPLEGPRRSVSVSASVSRVGVSPRASRGAVGFRVGLARVAGLAGLLRGVVRCDSRRFCLACPVRSVARAVSLGPL